MTPDVEGRIAASLRTLLDLNGLGNVKIIGYEVMTRLPGSIYISCLLFPSTIGTGRPPMRYNWWEGNLYVQMIGDSAKV